MCVLTILFHICLEELLKAIRGKKKSMYWEGSDKTVTIHRRYDHLLRKELSRNSRKAYQKKALERLPLDSNKT